MTTLKALVRPPQTTSSNRGLGLWLLGARISAGIFMTLLIIAAVFPTLLTSLDPIATNASQVLVGPSPEHWFGTDQSPSLSPPPSLLFPPPSLLPPPVLRQTLWSPLISIRRSADSDGVASGSREGGGCHGYLMQQSPGPSA